MTRLLERADGALYAAKGSWRTPKEGGKDRVVLAT